MLRRYPEILHEAQDLRVVVTGKSVASLWFTHRWTREQEKRVQFQWSVELSSLCVNAKSNFIHVYCINGWLDDLDDCLDDWQVYDRWRNDDVVLWNDYNWLMQVIGVQVLNEKTYATVITR